MQKFGSSLERVGGKGKTEVGSIILKKRITNATIYGKSARKH